MSDDIKKFAEDIWKKEFDKFIVNDIVDRYIKSLQQKLDQYKNNWEELKKWLEDEIIINKTNQIEDPNYPEWYIKWNCYLNLLNKMKEIEDDK